MFYGAAFSDDSDCSDFDYCSEDEYYHHDNALRSPTDLLLNDDDDYFNKKYLKFFWKGERNKYFNSVLIRSGDILLYDDLRLALKKDNLSVVERFFSCGINSTSQINERGWTPLDYAAFYASASSLHFILIGSSSTDLHMDVVVGGYLIPKDESKITNCQMILNEFGIKFSREVVLSLDLETHNEESFYDTKVCETLTVTEQNATSLLLDSMQLSLLIPTFKSISFYDFLLFKDEDLQTIGVHQLGYRKEILVAIDRFHRCPWPVSPLKLQEISRKISGAELISWVKNLKHQLKVAESTMLYVQRLVAEGEFENASMLEDIETRYIQTKKNLMNLLTEMLRFRQTLDKICKRGITEPPNLIEFKPVRRDWNKWLFVVCVPLLGTIIWSRVIS